MAISPISGTGQSILALQSRLNQFRADQLARDQAATLGSFNQLKGDQRRIGSQWAALRPDIDKAVNHLEDLINRVKVIRDHVRKLADLENRARSSTASEIAEYAVDFDDTLRKINAAANAMSQEPNLIGGTFANDYLYINDIDGDQATIPYANFTSGYTIVESGGNIWTKSTSTDRIEIAGTWIEDGSDDSMFVQYDSSGNLTGNSAVISQDLQLDSLSGSTIAFTQISTSDSYAGATLSTTGLNVLDAWAYEGLDTAAGRSRAATDIATALTTVKAQIDSYESALARARFDQGFSDVYATGTNSRISDINQQQLLALQESTEAARREGEASAFAFSRNAQLRASYSAMLGSGPTGTRFDLQV